MCAFSQINCKKTPKNQNPTFSDAVLKNEMCILKIHRKDIIAFLFYKMYHSLQSHCPAILHHMGKVMKAATEGLSPWDSRCLAPDLAMVTLQGKRGRHQPLAHGSLFTGFR